MSDSDFQADSALANSSSKAPAKFGNKVQTSPATLTPLPREFVKLEARWISLSRQKDEIAESLLRILKAFENKANTSHRSPFDVSRYVRGVDLELRDVMAIELQETSPELTWATDSLMDLIGKVAVCHGNGHFIASPRELAFVAPHRDTGALDAIVPTHRTVEILRQRIQQAHRGDYNDLKLAEYAPPGTQSISLFVNVDGNHWVHVLLSVIDNQASITLHDSLGLTSRPTLDRLNAEMLMRRWCWRRRT
ncbi:hypothetical protein BST61_g11488 [Cercospora zeina]